MSQEWNKNNQVKTHVQFEIRHFVVDSNKNLANNQFFCIDTQLEFGTKKFTLKYGYSSLCLINWLPC